MGELRADHLTADPREQTGPVGLGYIRVPSGSPESAGMVAQGIAVMEDFARRHGYRLGEVFVDDHPLRRLGWGSLLDAVRVVRPVAVLVPDVAGLRLPVVELERLRARLRHATNAPLALARPTAAWAAPDGRSPLPSAAAQTSALPAPAVLQVAPPRRARARRGRWRLS